MSVFHGPYGENRKNLLKQFARDATKYALPIPGGDTDVCVYGDGRNLYATELTLLFQADGKDARFRELTVGPHTVKGYNSIIGDRHVFVVSETHSEADRPYRLVREARRVERQTNRVPRSLTHVMAYPFKSVEGDMLYLYKFFDLRERGNLRDNDDLMITDLGCDAPEFAEFAADDLRETVRGEDVIVISPGNVLAGLAATLSLYERGVEPGIAYVSNKSDVGQKRSLLSNRRALVLGSSQISDALRERQAEWRIPEVQDIDWQSYLKRPE
ncbi:MAG: hypothetical protein HY369_00260 [Candidatus Aenigmarchaeota archaeon]|nr:hypothetical protein [Candidatus Aenigmarchaeota archaeon]